VLSTSTRNFPNRLGNGADVYLASAELSAVTATLGYIPTMDEYMERMKSFDASSADIYRYLNFDQIPDYTEIADTVTVELAQG
jgi:aconitate hydratase 2/2-methylisocitrate dehydratase